MIGNSITHNFEKPEYQPIWDQFFAPRNALNLGTSAYRTENLVWEIQNCGLEKQSPKVVVLEIGTNNVDEKHIFYCDVNHVFLNMDGSLRHDMMSDWLHPTPAGAKAWAQAMEPLLSELMGDKSLDTDIPPNTAIVPVSKLENDSYDWWSRHAEALHIKDAINPEIVLIGNSITHFWGGEPKLKYADGKARIPNGPNAWASIFGKENKIDFVDIGPKMLAPDGTLSKEIAGDFCHPTEKGYQIWADEIRSLVAEP